MSIPSNSVLRRILEDVVARPALPGLVPAERAETPDVLFEVWRTAEVHRPPFATSLHFWAHALKGFLAASGRSDLFGPFAGHCLCEAIAPADVAEGLGRLAPAGTAARQNAPTAGYRAGYRMIDQEDLVSWVAERPGEFVAVFRVRCAWLAEAEPIPVEPIEYVPLE